VEQEVEKEEVHDEEEEEEEKKEEEKEALYKILQINGLPARELVQLKRL
jgi:hypothetical protein